MADAVCIAASTSPGSMKFHVSCEWFAHTPARQSACNSTRTWTWLASALSRLCCAQVLHVMADLMGDHVGLRELTGLAAGVAGAEASLEILKERGVEINLAVVRAVERPHRGLREPTGRARDAGKHHERRRLVGFAVLREDLLPLR